MKPHARRAASHRFLAPSSIFAEEGPGRAPVDALTSGAFEAHCKILFPLFRYDRVPRAWEGRTWADLGPQLLEGYEQNFRHMGHAHVTYLVPPDGFDARVEPVSLEEIYRELGLEWDGSASITELLLALETPSRPTELFGPEEGVIPERIRRVIAPVLGDHTRSPRLLCFFDPSRIDEATGARADLFTTDLAGFVDGVVPPGYVSATPTMAFPEDESWYLYCDYDATYAIAGGTEAFVAGVLLACAENGIDVVEVDGGMPAAALEADPRKEGLEWDSFPSPYAYGPLGRAQYTKALKR